MTGRILRLGKAFTAAIHGRRLALMVAAVLVAAAGVAVGAIRSPAAAPAADANYTPAACNTAASAPGKAPVARCYAMVRTGTNHKITPDVSGPPPSALGPADIQSAYQLPATGQGQTVAVVEAFGNSAAETDLAVFRSQFGLLPCSSDNGCFTKVDQNGGTSYPADDPGWALETSLDLDAVSSACPACHILLVEANSANIGDLGVAVDTAVTMGAKYVSNSYGVPGEDPTETGFDQHYTHQGVAITAATGDLGAVTNWPATNPNVVSVGGTKLVKDTSTSRGWTESAWGTSAGGTGGGSGCSPYEPPPDYQTGIDTACSNRAIADVSADADPNSGLAVYDTIGQSGWLQVGGTSLSSPVVAAMYALAGPPRAGTFPVTYPYDNAVDPSLLNDVTAGSDGPCGNQLCNAQPGWDGPTGLGTPAGIGALTYRDHGNVAGAVTDQSTGKPVAGARVKIATHTTQTDAQGRYTVNLPVGTLPLSVSAFGYETASSSVDVTANQTTTHDVALTPIPQVTVSGTVTDASGHGWPLYAKVTASDGSGHDQTAFTDPATGTYTLHVLQNGTYSLHVAAEYPGYQPADKQLDVGTTNVDQDVALTIDALACTAPGYRADRSGVAESFDQQRTPPGWTVSNRDPVDQPGWSSTPGWQFTNPGHRSNGTGGSGNFAIVDSDHSGNFHAQDTRLTSPSVDLSSAISPVVQFGTELKPAVNSTATVEVSTDGGRTWTAVWTKKAFPGDPGPDKVVLALPQAAHQAHAQVSFHYVGSWSQYWAIDDMFIGNRTCTSASGGLVVGQVTDTSGAGVTGATVASVTNPAEKATTVATPDDPGIGDGVYWLFTTAIGQQQFTAAKDGYASQTASATVAANQATRLDFTLTGSGSPQRR